MKLGVLAVVTAMASGVALAGEKGKDETGEYWQSDDGVKHYYVFWDASTSAYNYNFSWTREDAAQGKNTYGGWQDRIDGPIWTFGKGVAWPGCRYINSFSVYGLHFESRENLAFCLEQDANPAIMSIGAYGIRSDVSDFSFQTYSNVRTVHLAESQTWTGPAATELSASPFYIVPGANDYTSYQAVMTAADDTVLTLEGDMVYASLDYAQANDLSNADIVIREPAILAFVGFWKGSGFCTSSLKARSITIDGGTGIYFGKRTTNARGETIKMTFQPLNGDSWERWGALGSAPQLTTNVASTIILRNGATLTAESETTVSTGVKIVVPQGETAALKGTFSFLDNLTEIELGEGAFLDISEATITGPGRPTVTGKGTFGPESARSGTDETGDWYIGNSLGKSYFLYQNTIVGDVRWSMNWNSYTRKGAQEGSGAVNWVDDSIFTLEKDTAYSGAYSFGGSPVVCGFLHEAPCNVSFEGGQVFRLGAYGIRATSNNKQFAIHASKVNPILTASQTWTGPEASELSRTPFVITLPYTYTSSYRMAVAAERDGIVWTLAGDMVVSMKTYTNDLSKTDVVIKEPAILSLPSGTYGTGRLKAQSLTIDGGAGIYFGKNTDVELGDIGNGNFTAYGIGSYALISPEQVAPVIKLKGDATLTAKEATTVEGGVTIIACTGATAAFAGPFDLADDRTVIRVEEDATLDLTGCTIAGGAFAISGGGTVRVNLVNLSAPFTVDPATKVEYVVSGEGRFFMSDEKLALMSGDIVVASGTMVVENAASVSSGGKVVTQDGSALMLIDATGFDPEMRMGGTKKVAAADPLIVTDAPRTGVVEVGSGETLEIWGNGLGTEATLSAVDGATIAFMHGAEVSAALQTKDSVDFKVPDASVTGLVSGAWTSLPTDAGDRYVSVWGPGLVRFSGGAEIRGSRFRMRSRSRAEITDRPFDAYVSLEFLDGHLTIRDGGKWLQKTDWIYLNMNRYLEGDCQAVLEIGKGGEYWRTNNTGTMIGQNDDSADKTAKLYINGGYFETAVPDQVVLSGNGIIEIDNGGYMSCECSVSGGGNKPRRVILGDGIWGNEMVYGGLVGQSLFQDGTSLSVEVKGNVLFDVGRTFGEDLSIANVAEGPVDWTFRDGSTCRVRGRADAKTTFVLRDVTVEPGARFDLGSTNPVADVKFDLSGKDSKDLALTWVAPPAGVTSGKAIGDGGALVASYYVPSNRVFNAGDLDSWHVGFSDNVTIDDLTFEEGSTFLFPYFGSGAKLVIGGKLTLPSAANYRIDAKGPKTEVENATILTAEKGIDGDCTWTCVGGVKKDRAKLETVEDSLLFSYDPLGSLLILR